MQRRVRVGIVDYLNSRPLAWAFLSGQAAPELEASYHPPARVADLLREGALEIGLVPSIELQRIPGLSVLPGLAVAATHEVRSVLLLSRRPVREIRSVALDRNSRTSAALVRILLEDRYGVVPETVSAAPDPEVMLRDADAALIIGDPALRVDRRAFRVLDLAAEWQHLTGLPFVFAVWAVAPGVDLPDLAAQFLASRNAGLAAIDTIARQAALEMKLELRTVREYLTRHLSFSLGEAELAGLAEFHRRAAARGLIDAARPLRLWSAS